MYVYVCMYVYMYVCINVYCRLLVHIKTLYVIMPGDMHLTRTFRQWESKLMLIQCNEFQVDKTYNV